MGFLLGFLGPVDAMKHGVVGFFDQHFQRFIWVLMPFVGLDLAQFVLK